MPSRKRHHTVSCREVQDRAAAVVQQHVQIQHHGCKCLASVLLHILFFAVAGVTFVFAVCRNLDHAITQQTVFNSPVTSLPEYHELTRRLDATFRCWIAAFRA